MKEGESKIVQGKAMISVRRTQLERVLEESGDEEVIMVRKFETEPALVTVAVGVTKNQGNYEFLRLDVGVTIPCYTEEISAVEIEATNWVDERLSVKLDELAQARGVI